MIYCDDLFFFLKHFYNLIFYRDDAFYTVKYFSFPIGVSYLGFNLGYSSSTASTTNKFTGLSNSGFLN